MKTLSAKRSFSFGLAASAALVLALTTSVASALNDISRADIQSIGESGIGYSYWWGHGAWASGGVTNPGQCTKTAPSGCGNCTHKADTDPNGAEYGADCSGFVAKAWRVPDSNTDTATDVHDYSTTSFGSDVAGMWSTVEKADAMAGDALVKSGHHIQLIENVLADGTFDIIEARGCDYMIGRRNVSGDGYHVIRRANVTGEAATPTDPADEGDDEGNGDSLGDGGSGPDDGGGSSSGSGSGSSTGSGSNTGSGGKTGGTGGKTGGSGGKSGAAGAGGQSPVAGDCKAQKELSDECPTGKPNCCPFDPDADNGAGGNGAAGTSSSAGNGGAAGGTSAITLQCQVNACADCSHDVSTEGVALKPTCSVCAATVCKEDAYCCNDKWDIVCVYSAADTCGN